MSTTPHFSITTTEYTIYVYLSKIVIYQNSSKCAIFSVVYIPLVN